MLNDTNEEFNQLYPFQRLHVFLTLISWIKLALKTTIFSAQLKDLIFKRQQHAL